MPKFFNSPLFKTHTSLTPKAIWFIGFVSLMALPGCSAINEAGKPILNYDKSNSEYYELVSKIQNNTANPNDYDEIIKVFPFTSLYEPNSDKEQSAKLISHAQMSGQQWRSCLKTNQTLLTHNYTSLTGHYGAAICATELGNLALGKFHNMILDNFIEAIWRTGNGQTPQTPFYITSANDLYAFIQLHQMVAVGQSLTYVNDLPVQAIKVQQPESNRTTTWYFDVTPTFRKGIINNVEKKR